MLCANVSAHFFFLNTPLFFVGQTALHYAVSRDRPSILRCLLKDRRVSLNIQNCRGYTPLLQAALERAHCALARLLRVVLERDAEMDSRESHGHTSCGKAARREHASVSVRALEANFRGFVEHGLQRVDATIKSKTSDMNTKQTIDAYQIKRNTRQTLTHENEREWCRTDDEDEGKVHNVIDTSLCSSYRRIRFVYGEHGFVMYVGGSDSEDLATALYLALHANKQDIVQVLLILNDACVHSSMEKDKEIVAEVVKFRNRNTDDDFL